MLNGTVGYRPGRNVTIQLGDTLMTTTQWADLVLVLHVAYAGFVVFGFVAVLIGWPLNWRWIHSCWFRFTHLTAIAIVAFLALLSLACPLTVLEYKLRGFTGNPVEEHFLGRLMSGLLFYEFPNWVFTTGYVALAALGVVLLLVVPVHPAGKNLALSRGLSRLSLHLDWRAGK